MHSPPRVPLLLRKAPQAPSINDPGLIARLAPVWAHTWASWHVQLHLWHGPSHGGTSVRQPLFTCRAATPGTWRGRVQGRRGRGAAVTAAGSPCVRAPGRISAKLPTGRLTDRGRSCPQGQRIGNGGTSCERECHRACFRSCFLREIRGQRECHRACFRFYFLRKIPAQRYCHRACFRRETQAAMGLWPNPRATLHPRTHCHRVSLTHEMRAVTAPPSPRATCRSTDGVDWGCHRHETRDENRGRRARGWLPSPTAQCSVCHCASSARTAPPSAPSASQSALQRDPSPGKC